jgi:hypothetical protein
LGDTGGSSLVENVHGGPRRPHPITYVAFGLSVLVSAAWWLYGFGQSLDVYDRIFGLSWINPLATLGIFALLGIAFDIVAGAYGGINRRLAVIAGLILFSPLVPPIYYAIWPPV